MAQSVEDGEGWGEGKPRVKRGQTKTKKGKMQGIPAFCKKLRKPRYPPLPCYPINARLLQCKWLHGVWGRWWGGLGLGSAERVGGSRPPHHHGTAWWTTVCAVG